jgi:hypothetical protein
MIQTTRQNTHGLPKQSVKAKTSIHTHKHQQENPSKRASSNNHDDEDHPLPRRSPSQWTKRVRLCLSAGEQQQQTRDHVRRRLYLLHTASPFARRLLDGGGWRGRRSHFVNRRAPTGSGSRPRDIRTSVRAVRTAGQNRWGLLPNRTQNYGRFVRLERHCQCLTRTTGADQVGSAKGRCGGGGTRYVAVVIVVVVVACYCLISVDFWLDDSCRTTADAI